MFPFTTEAQSFHDRRESGIVERQTIKDEDDMCCKHRVTMTVCGLLQFMRGCALCGVPMWNIKNVVQCIGCSHVMHGTCFRANLLCLIVLDEYVKNDRKNPTYGIAGEPHLLMSRVESASETVTADSDVRRDARQTAARGDEMQPRPPTDARETTDVDAIATKSAGTPSWRHRPKAYQKRRTVVRKRRATDDPNGARSKGHSAWVPPEAIPLPPGPGPYWYGRQYLAGPLMWNPVDVGSLPFCMPTADVSVPVTRDMAMMTDVMVPLVTRDAATMTDEVAPPMTRDAANVTDEVTSPVTRDAATVTGEVQTAQTFSSDVSGPSTSSIPHPSPAPVENDCTEPRPLSVANINIPPAPPMPAPFGSEGPIGPPTSSITHPSPTPVENDSICTEIRPTMTPLPSSVSINIPSAPPLPAPPVSFSDGPSITVADIGNARGALRKTSAKPAGHALHRDPMSDMFKSITDGVKLRKVEKTKRKPTYPCDAASGITAILARRIAFEISDSDSSSADEQDFSDDWL